IKSCGRRTRKERTHCNLSQIDGERCCSTVDVQEDAFIEASINNAAFDLETVFRAHFQRIARVIAGIVRDPARAEELAVEVFLKLSRKPGAQGDRAPGWLYRTAVRTGLNELRRRARRNRYEGL